MKWILTMLGFAGLVDSTRSEIVVAPVVVDRITHSFSATPDPEFPNFGGETFQFNAVPFAADLDTDTELSYTLRAPAGQKFQFNRGGSLYVDLKFGIESGQMAPAQIRMTLENPSGATPPFGDGILLLYGNELRTYNSSVGNGFVRFGGVAGGFPALMDFTGMTLHLSYAERNDGAGVRTFNFSSGSVITSYFTPSETDPGPMISLVPIPEPTTGALWTGAGLALVGARCFRKRLGRSM